MRYFLQFPGKNGMNDPDKSATDGKSNRSEILERLDAAKALMEEVRELLPTVKKKG